jgi:regulation of enolase protein 1 (concanavalin A-like superfamily)
LNFQDSVRRKTWSNRNLLYARGSVLDVLEMLTSSTPKIGDPKDVTPKELPQPLEWKNAPVSSSIDGQALTIDAGQSTDWFISPADGKATANAPILLFTPAADFALQAKVRVEFGKQWDAGTLVVYAGDTTWAKLAFELSVHGEPTIVSVVTRGVSDDCNSEVIDGHSVYLQIAKVGRALRFYWSTSGQHWRLVRTFTLDESQPLRAGFGAQSPVGVGATAVFSEIRYIAGAIHDVRKGE